MRGLGRGFGFLEISPSSARPLTFLVPGLPLVIKFFLEMRILKKAFGLRMAGLLTVRAVIDRPGRMRGKRVSDEGRASPSNRRRLAFFLVIRLLDYDIKSNCWGIYRSDKGRGLSKHNNKDIVHGAKTLKKAKNELDFGKGYRWV